MGHIVPCSKPTLYMRIACRFRDDEGRCLFLGRVNGGKRLGHLIVEILRLVIVKEGCQYIQNTRHRQHWLLLIIVVSIPFYTGERAWNPAVKITHTMGIQIARQDAASALTMSVSLVRRSKQVGRRNGTVSCLHC